MDFTKNKKRNESEKEDLPLKSPLSESYLGKSVTIKGNISSEGPVVMDGKITGNITSSDSITIGRAGSSSGNLDADRVDVYGKAKGSIFTRRKLILHNTSKFDGTITSTNIVIEEGGIFNGNMNMNDGKVK